MNKDKTRQIINVLVFIVTLAVNGLASGLPLNGRDTGEISDMFDVYFVPAGYVFAIWGVIYLLLLGFTVYQALPSQRENPAIRKINYLFAVNGLANSTWLVLWHYLLFPLTLPVMLIILITLVWIYVRLEIGLRPVSLKENLLVHLPFRVYLGWITVATVANVTSLLDSIDWGRWGLSEEAWMFIVLGVVVLIAGAVSWTRRDSAYLSVLIWALIGIVVQHAGVQSVVTATWIAVGLVAVFAITTFFRPQPA